MERDSFYKGKLILDKLSLLNDDLNLLKDVLNCKVFELNPDMDTNPPWFTIRVDNGDIRHIIEAKISILNKEIEELENEFANL